jgi:uncharacterized protein YgiM (DUF1202 family)
MKLWRIASSVLIVGVVLFLTIAQQISAQTATPRPACQTYHLTENSVPVRQRASAASTIIGGLTRTDIVCVTSITGNGQWYEVDLNPNGDQPLLGFVSADVIEAGPPSPNASRFCNAYTVIRESAAVRTCTSPECSAIKELTLGDQICATGYFGNYVTWLQVDNGTGLVGYVDIRQMTVVRDDIDCNGWDAALPTVNVYSKPDARSTVAGTLAQGARVCQIGEAEQAADWIRINVDGKEGFVFYELLQSSVEEPVSDVPTATATEFVTPRLTANENKNVRASGSTSSALVGVLARGETVDVIGASGDGWYQVRLPNGVEGWVSQAATTVAGDLSTVAPNAVAQASTQPAASPTPPEPTETLALVSATPTEITPTVQAGSAATIAPSATTPPSQTPGATQVDNSAAVANQQAEGACVYYVVNVDSAIVRGTPSTNGTPVTTLRRGTPVCVRGVVPFLENEWFIVDLNPNGSAPTQGFMFQPLLIPMTSAPTPTTVGQNQILTTNNTQTPVPTAQIEGTVLAAVATTPAAVNGATVTPNICPPPDGQGVGGTFATADPNLISAITGCVTTTPTPIASAQPTQFASNAILAKDVSLAAMRIRNVEMRSPQSSVSLRLRRPDDWAPTGNNILYLNLEYFETSDPSPESDFGTPVTQLTVRLGDTIVSTVSLTKANVGVQTLQIPLPADVLSNPTRNTFPLELELDARDHCRNRMESRVFIRSDLSFVHYEYREFLPLLDLARYPRPFYNNRLFVAEQESVWLVLPPNPTQAELDASASIAAGLGRLTGSDIVIRVTTQDQLLDIDRQGNHLILVGRPDTNPLTKSLYDAQRLQTSLDASGALSYRGEVISSEHGVIDLIPHPENPKRAVMVVTGQSDEALRKAGQALGGPPSLMGLGGSLAVLTERRDRFYSTSTVATNLIKFSQLGATEDVVLSGIGTQIFDATFNIPFGSNLSNDAYVEILYNNAQTLNVARANFAVLVNEIPIGSVTLGVTDVAVSQPSPVAGYKVLRVPIPPSAVAVGGSNSLSLVLDLNNNFQCEPPNRNSTWFTISKESSLYLPREILDPSTFVPMVGLFPSPFNSSPNLSTLWVSLPEKPTQQEWETGIKAISRLGADSFGEGFIPRLTTGGIPAGEDLSQYNFIVVGRPTTNSFLNQLNVALPQPFVDGTDTIQQNVDDVSYQLFAGLDIGILQALRSPFSQRNVVLAITGTSSRGEAFAADALLSQRFGSADLMGNIVYASVNAAIPIDTRQIVSAEEFIDLAPELATESAIVPPTDVPLMIVTVTPGPTLTPTPTRTPAPAGASGVVTVAPSPTVVTPIATFTPLDIAAIQPEDGYTPTWLVGMLVVTGILIALMVIYAVYAFFIKPRRSKKPTKTLPSASGEGKNTRA